ncbi:MAG: Hpt domain-containing protein [Sulfurimonas sp.]
MYYITNQHGQIIAADHALLELLGLNDIEELYKKIALEELSFTSVAPGEMTLRQKTEQQTYRFEGSRLSSMFGDLTLNLLQTSDIRETESGFDQPALIDDTQEEALKEEEEEAIFLLEDNVPLEAEETEEEPSGIPESGGEEERSDDEREEEEAILLLENNEPLEAEEKEEEPSGIPESGGEENSLKETDTAKTESNETNDLSPIFINVNEVSQTIGITKKEYSSFLNEFIDTAISLEKDLKSSDPQEQKNAIETLIRLSEVLHLPRILQVIREIEESTPEEKEEAIETLYNHLARLTTQEQTIQTFGAEKAPEDIGVKQEEPASAEPWAFIGIEPEAEAEISPAGETPEEEKILPEGSFGSLTMNDLEEVKPIHFDFRMEDAANELNLPVDLIREFVNDFIEQARSETVNMLDAYQQGDMDRVQKIGHLLKGASSNLRINPLADTLFEIQFCEDSSQLESLIKNYWAHFISFETRIKLSSN